MGSGKDVIFVSNASAFLRKMAAPSRQCRQGRQSEADMTRCSVKVWFRRGVNSCLPFSLPSLCSIAVEKKKKKEPRSAKS